MPALVNLLGKKFGRLRVIEPVDSDSPHMYWKCLCDCGNIVNVRGQNLREGVTKSCGCLRSELSSKRAKKKFGSSPLQKKVRRLWWSMIMRCFNKNNAGYKNYGARGITVCDEWHNSRIAFYDYVSKLEHFGEEGYSLDRINNDGNYEPGNVRWATVKQQSLNRRNNVR